MPLKHSQSKRRFSYRPKRKDFEKAVPLLLARRAGGGSTEESTAERAQTGRKKRRKSQFMIQQTSNITAPGLVSERSIVHAPLKARRLWRDQRAVATELDV